MKVIEKLYNERCQGIEKLLMENDEYKKAVNEAGKAEVELLEIIGEKERDLMEKCCRAKEKIAQLEAFENFREGFKVGINLEKEILSE